MDGVSEGHISTTIDVSIWTLGGNVLSGNCECEGLLVGGAAQARKEARPPLCARSLCQQSELLI